MLAETYCHLRVMVAWLFICDEFGLWDFDAPSCHNDTDSSWPHMFWGQIFGNVAGSAVAVDLVLGDVTVMLEQIVPVSVSFRRQMVVTVKDNCRIECHFPTRSTLMAGIPFMVSLMFERNGLLLQESSVYISAIAKTHTSAYASLAAACRGYGP